MIKLNGVELNFTTFPNGETKVDGEEIENVLDSCFAGIMVDFKYESDSDLIKLLFVKKHLDNLVTDGVHLKIWYMPYSRQDRVQGDSVFTLKYIADFINSLNFSNVIIVEPHSDVTMALVNNSYATYPTVDLLEEVLEEIGFDSEKDYIFFPDAGASKRYSHMIGGFNTLVGFKKRDFVTGNISHLQVVGDIPLLQRGFKVLIIDDLCSKGGTFVLASDKLKELGAKDVYLLTTHCENTIYTGALLNPTSNINRVFTTDSILTQESMMIDELSKIKVFKGRI